MWKAPDGAGLLFSLRPALLRRRLHVLALLRPNPLQLLGGGGALLGDLVELGAPVRHLLLHFGEPVARALQALLRFGQFLGARGGLLAQIGERLLDARNFLGERLAVLRQLIDARVDRRLLLLPRFECGARLGADFLDFVQLRPRRGELRPHHLERPQLLRDARQTLPDHRELQRLLVRGEWNTEPSAEVDDLQRPG